MTLKLIILLLFSFLSSCQSVKQKSCEAASVETKEENQLADEQELPYPYTRPQVVQIQSKNTNE